MLTIIYYIKYIVFMISQYKAYKIGRYIRQTLTMTLAASAVVSIYPYGVLQVSAQQAEDLKEKSEEAAEMLENIFDGQYESILEEVKTLVKENGWDYELTMMSFYDNENPFKTMDYTKLIAAYATIKALAEKDSSIMLHHMLTDVEFISYTYEEEEFEDGARYGVITLQGKDPEYIFEYFGLSMDDKIYYNNMSVQDLFESKQKAIENAIYGVKLAQNLYIATRGNITTTSSAEQEEVLNYLAETGVSSERKNLIITAMTLLGEVPYEWGGKPDHAGMDTTWWLFDESGRQKGLDCSGFVQWAFMTAGYTENITDNLLSTSSTVNSFEKIDEDELEPGDLGLFNSGNLSSNHVGIYLGDGKWIHCSSSRNTVVIAEDIDFNVFVRVIDAEEKEDEPEMTISVGDHEEAMEKDTDKEKEDKSDEASNESSQEEVKAEEKEDKPDGASNESGQEEAKAGEKEEQKENQPQENGQESEKAEDKKPEEDSPEAPPAEEETEIVIDDITTEDTGVYMLDNGQIVTEDDIYLLAQLVSHEARGQGVNGWAAVAEVVINRANSSLFPNTISEVIYQNGQFSGVSKISSITPSENIIDIVRDVVKGDIRIFNNSQVLYFRNPKTTTGVDASTPLDWGTHTWYTSVGAHAFYTQD